MSVPVGGTFMSYPYPGYRIEGAASEVPKDPKSWYEDKANAANFEAGFQTLKKAISYYRASYGHPAAERAWTQVQNDVIQLCRKNGVFKAAFANPKSEEFEMLAGEFNGNILKALTP